MTLAEMLIKFRVTGTVDVRRSLKEVEDGANSAGNAVRSSLTPLEEMGRRLYQLGRFHVIFLGLKKAVTDAANMDSLKMSLLTIEGSMENVNARMAELRKVALLPGVNLQNATSGFIRLRAAGMGVGDSLNAIQAMGNAVASMGGGKEAMEGVIRAMSQIANKPSLMGQELLQMMEWLPNSAMLLKRAFGTIDTEAIRKMGISGEQAFRMILAEMNKLPKVQLGIKGQLEQIGDQFTQTSAAAGTFVAAFMQVFQPAIINGLKALETFFSNMPSYRNAVVGVASAFGTIAGILGTRKIITFIGEMIVAFQNLRKTIMALGLSTAIAEALATGGASAIPALKGAATVAAGGLALGIGTGYIADLAMQNLTKSIGGGGKNATELQPPAPYDWSKFAPAPMKMIEADGKAVNPWYGGGSPYNRTANMIGNLAIMTIQADQDFRRMQMNRLNEIADNTRKTASALDLRQEMIGGGVLARAGVTAGERKSEIAGQLVTQFAGATVTVGGSYLERQIRKVVQDERRRGINPMNR